MRKYSVADLNDLLSDIKRATNLNEREIEKKARYKDGYIAQVRSIGQKTGSVSKLLIEKLRLVFYEDLNKTKNVPYPDTISRLIENVLLIKAGQDVDRGLLIEILARLQNKSVTSLSEEVRTALDSRILSLREQLLRKKDEPES